MSCGCGDMCECGDYEQDRLYVALINDLSGFFLRKEYSEILERLEKEFPLDLAGITKLKLSE